MKKDVLNIEVCNSASNSVATDLFTIGSVEGTGVSSIVSTGKYYDDVSGASSGLQMPSRFISSAYIDETRNILYVFTKLGIWVYDIDADTGSVIDTSTSVIGDPLPNYANAAIIIDEINNILYCSMIVSSYAAIWKYNIATNTGLLYTSSSGVSGGDNIPTATTSIDSFAIDTSNNYLYAPNKLNIWRLNMATNIGDDITSSITGDAYPLIGKPISTTFDNLNNVLWIAKEDDYIFRLNVNTLVGKIYNLTTGVANGDNIPSDSRQQIALGNNVLYVPTFSGVWIYDILTSTGSIIDTLTPVNGDSFPDNDLGTVAYSDNNIYVGSDTAVWKYDTITNTGTNLTVPDNGDTRLGGGPGGTFSIFLSYFNDTLWEPSAYRGAWSSKFASSGNDITITSNSQSSVSYDYIVNDVQQSPIEISKIILTTDNDRQKYNSLTHIIETIAGSDVQYTVHFSNYVNPLMPFKQVHVDLEQPLLIDYEKFLRITIEANTCIQLLFEYEQQSPASLIEHLSPDEKDILPIYYEEQKDGKLIKTVSLNKSDKVAMIPEPEFKWLPPWVVMAIISILLQFKSKK